MVRFAVASSPTSRPRRHERRGRSIRLRRRSCPRTEERLDDLVDVLVELGQRLDTLEAIAVENAGDGGDPLATILARLDAFDNRLTRLERHLRRPPPFPITVIENVDDTVQRKVDEVSYDLSRVSPPNDTSANAGIMICTVCTQAAMAAFNQRLDRCADQFGRMRERVAAIEARTATKERRHEGCLLADQQAQGPASSPAQLVKVPHAPVYGPPASGSRNAARPPPAISAAISVTRAGGRNLSDPDPFPPPGRAA